MYLELFFCIPYTSNNLVIPVQRMPPSGAFILFFSYSGTYITKFNVYTNMYNVHIYIHIYIYLTKHIIQTNIQYKIFYIQNRCCTGLFLLLEWFLCRNVFFSAFTWILYKIGMGIILEKRRQLYVKAWGRFYFNRIYRKATNDFHLYEKIVYIFNTVSTNRIYFL